MRSIQILSLVTTLVLLVGEPVGSQEPGYLMNASSQFGSLYAGIFYAPHRGGTLQQLAQPASHITEWRRRMTQMAGNRYVLVYEPPAGNFNSIPLHVFDADTATYVPFYTIQMTAPYTALWPTSFLIDQEGDLVLCGLRTPSITPGGIYRLLSDGTLQRLSPALPASEMDRLIVDIDTGDYIVSQSPTLWRVRPSGATSTIASLYHALGPWQDPGTGEFLLWAPTAFPAILFKVTTAGSISSLIVPGIDLVDAMTVDETPSGMGEYVIGVGGTVLRYSRQGGSVTTISSFPWNGGYGMHYGTIRDLMMDRVRNLSTANAGARNRWTLFVSFPFDAMSTYLCLVGVSGVRPGITLPDGKIIRLNPDAATGLGLAGLLPGFTGLTGTLDSMGRAQGMIDLSWLPPAAVGTPFWMVGLVLDPSPPVIRRVSPAIVVQIR